MAILREAVSRKIHDDVPSELPKSVQAAIFDVEASDGSVSDWAADLISEAATGVKSHDQVAEEIKARYGGR